MTSDLNEFSILEDLQVSSDSNDKSDEELIEKRKKPRLAYQFDRNFKTTTTYNDWWNENRASGDGSTLTNIWQSQESKQFIIGKQKF
jgi:hypothetical protein